jgi:hypothetical protein
MVTCGEGHGDFMILSLRLLLKTVAAKTEPDSTITPARLRKIGTTKTRIIPRPD